MAAVIAAGIFLASAPAFGDKGPLRMRSPARCETERGSKVTLPPGVFLPEEDYGRLDLEIKRLQERETRLQAERDLLLDRARGIRWGWWGVGVGLLMGFVAGAYLL